MELRHLRYFIAVAEELHFGKAAARLNISQPPLSQQIRQLEETLGFPLLYRNKQHVELTAAGKVFLEEARTTLAHVEQARFAAQEANRGAIGRLAVGFVGSATYSAAPIMQRFLQHFPKIHITLHQMKSENQLQALHERTLHVGIIRKRIRHPHLVSEWIGEEKFAVILPEDHPLAGKEALHLQDLADHRFIMTPRGSSFHDTVIRICEQAGFTPNVALELPEILTIVVFVSQGMGLAIVPASFSRQQNKGVVYKALTGTDATLETYFVWRKEEQSPVLQQFLRISKKNVPGVVDWV